LHIRGRAITNGFQDVLKSVDELLINAALTSTAIYAKHIPRTQKRYFMSNRNTILLTGGTGKISRRLAPLLSSAGYNVLIASRSGTCPPLLNCKAITFDWLAASTYTKIDMTSISAIFLIAPPMFDPFPPLKDFIDTAVSRGVKRLVLISGSLVNVGDGPMMARVSMYITSLNIEYAILRPSWFMGMFMYLKFDVGRGINGEQRTF